ncbi:nicotinate-nucleotide adenylyltransferase [Iocasia frigidifontis]|uniref:Probable nicotinate-nucleotide adenylyltransferase n=1 Tax=Iocasia fonsfrigidae TaxID=2682810 RepID=A0A8A7K8X8_9FIRM|nr:nicotinate-nucleotide adenylyltransferase [Iocasia fonsfrigidae]QTL97660.1 nicotinate-nucleotide adenylyltransferase [Iocasia fonsfrigidae]
MELAILGGTFDPVHLGHLLIAEQVLNRFDLDKIIFMPAGVPPHKNNSQILPSHHRLEMLKLAIRDNPLFNYSRYELDKEGQSYTADTLRYFKNKQGVDRVYFIIGADSLLDIFNWKEPDYLLANAFFIVAQRPGYSIDNILRENDYSPYFDRIFIMNSFFIDISSTFIRQAVKNGDSIRYQVTEAVKNYIENKKLYLED